MGLDFLNEDWVLKAVWDFKDGLRGCVFMNHWEKTYLTDNFYAMVEFRGGF